VGSIRASGTTAGETGAVVEWFGKKTGNYSG
jgi:hypothetical protein